jgi:hypothetical protein
MRPASLERALAAKEKLRRMVGDSPDVCGIGIAALPDGFGVKLNLRRTPEPGTIPDDVDGVPVIVDVVGSIKASS